MQSAPDKKIRWWRTVVRLILGVFTVIILLVLLRGGYAFRDRIPGYSLDINVSPAPSQAEPRPLRAGFAREKITPDVSDSHHPVWLAGFSQNRSATAIHDDLWATGLVLDDGSHRVGIVTIDAIGFFQDDVVAVRKRLPSEARLDFAVVTSTHNHSTPDLMGLWGPSFFKTGVDPAYKERVIQACVQVLSAAARDLQPALIRSQTLSLSHQGLVSDTRKPEVFDSDLRVIQFAAPDNRRTLGSLVTWGNHPETVWSENREITSDFCGYVREALAEGIQLEGKEVMKGLGGIHVYASGAVGGLMSTTPSTLVRDPFSGQEFQKPSHDKARAVGRILAQRLLPALQSENPPFQTNAPLGIQARTIRLKLDNNGYLVAGFLGLLDRGYVAWKTLRSEVSLITIGDIAIACVPGEIYPEIVNGGIEHPEGADFAITPVEVPPLRELMPGETKFVLGLANDEVGYLVPKSQWDRKPPYTYGAKKAPYGEVNSVGPETATAVHGALKELCLRARTQAAPTGSPTHASN